MVECSAILISKILKASNRHFSFDGWHRPVPPILVSQQWPAPADPLRGEKMGSGNTRCPVVRFERWRNTIQTVLPLGPTRRCKSMTRYLKRCKGEQVTSESNVMSLRFYLCVYIITFWPHYTLLCVRLCFSCLSSISISVCLPVCLECDAGLTLSWGARLIAAQMEGKEET